MRKLLLLLGLVALLALILTLANRAAGLHYTVPGEAGDLVYTAAFTDGADGWSQYDDGRLSAQAQDGALILRVNQLDSAAFSAGLFHFTDVDFSATARAVEGPIDNGFGLMVGLQTQDNTRLNDDSYLLFLISSDGYYSLRQRLAGAERELSTWISSAAIRDGLGQDNALQAVVSDGQARFTVNGQPLAFCVPNTPGGASTFYLDTCVDGTMVESISVSGAGAGQVGVVALSTATGGPGTTVQFDNVVVYAP